jgi:hypothetical protein
MNELPTLVEFLTQIATGGFAGVIIAFLLEKIPAFQNLDSELKRWIVLALFLVLPAGSVALLQFVPADVWAAIEPYWRAIALGFLGWVSSQVAHAFYKPKSNA